MLRNRGPHDLIVSGQRDVHANLIALPQAGASFHVRE
jgi:hypothetical protein